MPFVLSIWSDSQRFSLHFCGIGFSIWNRKANRNLKQKKVLEFPPNQISWVFKKKRMDAISKACFDEKCFNTNEYNCILCTSCNNAIYLIYNNLIYHQSRWNWIIDNLLFNSSVRQHINVMNRNRTQIPCERDEKTRNSVRLL